MMKKTLAGAVRFAVLWVILGIFGFAYLAPAAAQQAATPERSAKIDEFVKLMDDPEVRAWLATAPTKTASPEASASAHLAEWDDALRNHMVGLVQAFWRLPAEIAGALQRLAAAGSGFGSALLLLLTPFAAGYLAEWLAKRFSGRRSAVPGGELSTTDPSSLFLQRMLPVFAFAIGGIVAFLLLGGPPLLRRVAVTYLIALIVVRFVWALAEVLGAARQPATVADGVATNAVDRAFWQRRIKILVAYFMAAWATVSLLPDLGYSPEGKQLVAYLAGIGLLAIAIEGVWRAPGEHSSKGTARRWMFTIYLIALWCIWCIGLNMMLWLGLYALILPKALSLTGDITTSFVARRKGSAGALSIRDVLIIRGARAAVILLAVLWLVFVLRVNPGVLASTDTFGSQIMRALLRGVLILVVADLIWQLLKTHIDATLATDGTEGALHSPEATRRGRLRTLLPIFRNALAVLIVVVAGLMVLAELGVQIGPLIAGAGIFGVAIGFGSQTLVKDIVSGVFYLADDAFRVGEYIQSGSYKGTVESFSLRSIRLRHHRGPVFTVPFGELGAVQNMSRDWAIDKFMIRVPFETDLKLVKKLTKTVGAQLMEDPELAPNIIQTVKMKGVEQFSDYGIELSFSVTTTPGNQTSIRRRAYAMIKDAFAANGIEFARPSVSVGNDDHPAAAGAASAVIAKQKLAEAAGV